MVVMMVAMIWSSCFQDEGDSFIFKKDFLVKHIILLSG